MPKPGYKQTMTPDAIKQRQGAARKHGIHAFERRGPDALTDPGRIGRLAELRQQVASHPGRVEMRQELAARVALIVDMGMGELAQARQDGIDLSKAPAIRFMGTYMSLLQRLLDSFPQEEPPPADITQVLRGNTDG